MYGGAQLHAVHSAPSPEEEEEEDAAVGAVRAEAVRRRRPQHGGGGEIAEPRAVRPKKTEAGWRDGGMLL